LALIDSAFLGSGVNIGPEPHVACKKHWFSPPDQLYRPHMKLGLELYDFVVAKDLLGESKYTRIILYEAFLLIRSGGKLVFEFYECTLLNRTSLLNELQELDLYKESYEIFYQGRDDGRLCIVIEKTKSVVNSRDAMYRWSFGIITNGNREESIKDILESIRAQNIPEYEVMICGTYSGAIESHMRIFPFNERDDRGWITRKKNILCENAYYENICILHDRIILGQDWYYGMQQWGNQFQVLGTPIIVPYRDGELTTNWERVKDDFTVEDDYKIFHSNGRIASTDWDCFVHIGGPAIIIKKSIWKKEPWNEELYWGDAEDIMLSRAQHRRGLMIRHNPLAKMYALHVSGIILNNYYEMDRKRRGKFCTEYSLFVIAIMKIMDVLGFRRNSYIVKVIVRLLKKNYKAHNWQEEN